MTKLKVGIIGLGGIARAHCNAIAPVDNVEIVAVADLFEGKRRESMTKYGIPRGYASHTEFLADDEIDAVRILEIQDAVYAYARANPAANGPHAMGAPAAPP